MLWRDNSFLVDNFSKRESVDPNIYFDCLEIFLSLDHKNPLFSKN